MDELTFSLPSVTVATVGHAGDSAAAEIRRLQDMLGDALRREAEAHKRVRHLYDVLQQDASCRSPELGRDSPEGGLWLGELGSQSSDTSSPPAVVVSGSPRSQPRARGLHLISRSQPNSPTVNKRRLVSPPIESPTHKQLSQSGYFSTSEHGLSNGHSPGARQWPSDDLSTSLGLPTHLAPSPQSLTDVRRDREKPPPLQIHSAASEANIVSSTVAKHPPLTHRKTSPDPIAVIPRENSFEKKKKGHKKTQSLDKLNFELQKEASQPVVQAAQPEKEREKERKNEGGRKRSSTTITLPNWLRRKKALARRTNSSPGNESRSIDELFFRFVHTSHARPCPPAKHIDRPWTEVCSDVECGRDVCRYRDAVWELFQEETKFLTRQLHPLEQVYKGFLEELHFHNILKIADVDKIFANLSEMCELSSSVASDLFRLFDGRKGKMIAANGELILAYSMFGHKFNPVYQRFCVNFERQRGFVRVLEQSSDFQEYLRMCRSHDHVHKNDLTALLIAPMQHQCHQQLLLEKVLQRTSDPADKAVLSSAIKAFVVSLRELEGNIEEHKRSAELLELQETLVWPPVATIDPEAYIPESLADLLSQQPCREALVSKERQLLFKGALRLLDGRGRPAAELHAFLLTDLLLLTERKQAKRELTQYVHVVYQHPLFLGAMDVHDAAFSPSHKHTLTLVERSPLQQRMAVYSLQVPSKEEKDRWLAQLLNAQDLLWQRQNNSIFESDL